jgi:hypothetical protein
MKVINDDGSGAVNPENDYLSKNTNNGQQNTIQKTTI